VEGFQRGKRVERREVQRIRKGGRNVSGPREKGGTLKIPAELLRKVRGSLQID